MAEDGLKVVIVGDGTIGKTCMLSTYVSGEFPEEYVPTVFTNYSKNVTVDGKQVKLGLWDTAGQEDYDRLRPLSYKKANIVMVCYSIDSADSVKHVREKWAVEARTYAPTADIVLVGLKIDLREAAKSSNAQYYDPSKPSGGQDDQYYLAEDGEYYPVSKQTAPAYELVDYETGKQLAVEIGASAFKECSARTGENLKETFDAVLTIASRKAQPARGCCSVM
eukprot:TRINITY_DN4164_c0_g1_i1.p1 TRINITY_DN4164_c0_g1~~TRINITY_DN4164_c0_g1_i1.p1  ORF type:complete len:222 (-),score=56.18 TRINITY_DN4164_c0_g1_i1:98-763(-)